MYDALIRNARIVDGTGSPWYLGDVGVQGRRIAAVGRLAGEAAARVVEADGQVLCPGFVDAHVHGDAVMLGDPAMEAAVRQGVTTFVIGQDGIGFAPASEPTMAYMRDYFAALNGFHDLGYDWHTVAGYLARFDERTAINAAFLIPHGCLRCEAMGLEERAPTGAELARMQALADQGMREGAVGFSTGLDYIPCLYADTEELIAVARAVAPYGGIYVTHQRSYGERVAEAVAETLAIGERGGVAVHISHYNGPADVLLPLIDAGRARGADVTFDSYPYLAGCTIMGMVCLPDAMQQGGIPATLDRLREPATRRELARWLESPRYPLEEMRIAAVFQPENKRFEGLSPLEAAHAAGKEAEGPLPIADFLCDLLIAERMAVCLVVHDARRRGEEDLRRIMAHPAHMAGSDGIYTGGKPHPRGWGSFARYLGVYTRRVPAQAERGFSGAGVYTLEEAVRHLAAHAARRHLLRDRGLLWPGFAADLVLFDPDTVIDRATYEDGARFAAGVSHVWVNGRLVLDDGRLTGATPGRSLRGPGCSLERPD
jgi:N-acyl-D-amino-acid deacylase